MPGSDLFRDAKSGTTAVLNLGSTDPGSVYRLQRDLLKMMGKKLAVCFH